jgi:hypothetical protein
MLFAGWLAEQVSRFREHEGDANGKIASPIWKSSFSMPALRDIVPVFVVKVFADIGGREALIRKVRHSFQCYIIIPRVFADANMG